MDNAYICGFVDSKDIREYLKKIDYEFTPVQYAYLVWQSQRLTIGQRHDEWKKLINTIPDCKVIIRSYPQKTGWNSLHRMLKDYMTLENKYIDRLAAPEGKAVYRSRWYELGYWRGGEALYSTYENCKAGAYDYAVEEKCRFEISKIYVDNPKYNSARITASFNPEGGITDIEISGGIVREQTEYESELWFEAFDNMWYDFPIPFNKGDVVCDCFERKPFVLMSTMPWYKNEHPPKGKHWKDHMTHMDMDASGYFFDTNALSMADDWADYKYLNLEYYREDLIGGEQLIGAYSLFEKGRIDAFTLLKLQRKITADAIARRERNELRCYLSPEMVRMFDLENEIRGGINGQ